MINKLVLLTGILLICCLLPHLMAQTGETVLEETPQTADSTSVAISDSIQAQQPDSLYYDADEILLDYEAEQIYLYGNTKIAYQTSTITSDSLQIDLKQDRAFSNGQTVLQDTDQIIIGTGVLYDVNSQTGILSEGLSKMDKGYYYGRVIRKVDKDIYDVDNGRFTTCDHADPDFWFWSHQMRIYRGDKVVGKPVVFYVNHFPVFYFPFATFSIKKGRKAGFLVPEPSYNTVDGKLVRNIAWFYPYGDWADFTIGMDLMEKTGWKANFSSQYVKRYEFSGSSDLSYQKRISDNTTNYDWALRANHHHDLPERSSFDLNLDIVSNKRIWESSDDIDESLAQQLTSSMSYRRPLLNSYLNVASSYTQDLVNDNVYVNLPTASFSLPSRPVHEFFTKSDVEDVWWTKFNLSYNTSLSHTGRVTSSKRSFSDIIWSNTLDPADTTNQTYINEHHAGIRHNASLSYNWKAFGWLNFSQGLSYTESWFDRDRNQKKWVRGNAYSASSGVNFNIYGIRNFPGYKVSAIRHIITPSASVSYSPDQNRNQDFYSFGSIGLPSGRKSAYLNLNMNQTLQTKYLGKDKTQRRLNDFITMSSGTSLNLMVDKKQMNNITHRMSFRPPAMDPFKISIGTQDYTLSDIKLGYTADLSTTQNPYKVHWNDLDLRNKYLTQGISFSGTSPYTEYFPRAKNKLFDPYSAVDSLQVTSEDLATGTQTSDNWSISISHDLFAPSNLLKPTASNLRLGTNLKLTTNWSASYSAYYNLKTDELLSQSFQITRKLHCWQIDISYNRRNEFWDYRIVFFNTALPDALKFQTRDNRKY